MHDVLTHLEILYRLDRLLIDGKVSAGLSSSPQNLFYYFESIKHTQNLFTAAAAAAASLLRVKYLNINVGAYKFIFPYVGIFLNQWNFIKV